MSTCETCKWWKTVAEVNTKNRAVAINTPEGICGLINNIQRPGEYPTAQARPAIGYDPRWPTHLFTNRTFGCNQWEASHAVQIESPA